MISRLDSIFFRVCKVFCLKMLNVGTEKKNFLHGMLDVLSYERNAHINATDLICRIEKSITKILTTRKKNLRNL